MLEQLIKTVLTYLNASGYYKSAEEIQNAINIASLDLYKRLRGNMAQYSPGRPQAAVTPEQTNVTTDAIQELYRNINCTVDNGGGLVYLTPESGRVIDIVFSIEVIYDGNRNPYPVNIVPDNQYLMMANNPVIPPVPTRPLGRFYQLIDTAIVYEVAPKADLLFAFAKALVLPGNCAFTFVDEGAPLPKIVITQDWDWTPDKLDNLVYGTVANLGFNLSNGVLVQSGNAMNEKVL